MSACPTSIIFSKRRQLRAHGFRSGTSGYAQNCRTFRSPPRNRITIRTSRSPSLLPMAIRPTDHDHPQLLDTAQPSRQGRMPLLSAPAASAMNNGSRLGT
nr:hypothetical protein CFP56_55942 [Quercus suber]